MSVLPSALPERLRVKIRQVEECWEWTTPRTQDGYGLTKTKARRTQVAHRAVYEALVGAIPAGLQLDHLCRNRACVNPAHLEPVTPLENTRRSERSFAARTHCLTRGHELTPENVYVKPSTGRAECRACRAIGRHRRRRVGLRP